MYNRMNFGSSNLDKDRLGGIGAFELTLFSFRPICALFDTLIADADGVYDPSTYNDRLLLGLKGTMSEAELHILKARMLEGRRAKARRGELGKSVPMGYVHRPSGEVAFDPDEQAQATIRLVFDLFVRFRTVGKVMRYLVDHDIPMPVRVRGGPRKGELEWRRVFLSSSDTVEGDTRARHRASVMSSTRRTDTPAKYISIRLPRPSSRVGGSAR